MADVLLVEDSEMEAGIIRQFIRGEHEVVGVATTAAEAVRQVEACDPDVVIMDLNLAEGSGIEATETIKAANESLPVIVSTLHVTRDVKERAFAAGADAYLTKPYDREALLEALEH